AGHRAAVSSPSRSHAGWVSSPYAKAWSGYRVKRISVTPAALRSDIVASGASRARSAAPGGFEQRLDDGTIRHHAALAPGDDLAQRPLQPFQVADLLPHVVEVFNRDGLDVRARVSMPAVDELQQAAYLV